jgi:hypothetical protein
VNRIRFAAAGHCVVTCLIALAWTLPCEGASILVGTRLDGLGESTVNSTHALAQGFTINQTADVTAINLQMSGFGFDNFTVWLTNAIGPTTTQANVLFETRLTFPNTGGAINGQTVSTATNFVLFPGSYFLVLASSQTSLLQGLLDDGPASILPTTTGTVGTFFAAFPVNLNTSFPPASSFTVVAGIGEFQIVGNAVPESSTSFVIVGVLTGAALRKIRLRR